jgi:nucleotide-binding universal stress UspA family protein
MFERILVVFDGSRPSKEAFWYSLEIACRFGAGLHAVSAIRPSRRQELKKLIDLAKAEGLTVTSETVRGPAAEHLLAIARKRKADLIVMNQPGSVSEVLQHAQCPVLIVR